MRIVIENVVPQLNCGNFPIKRAVGEKVTVQADIFTDGHDELAAILLYRNDEEEKWQEVAMKPLGNDRWEGSFTIDKISVFCYTIQAWADTFGTWRKNLQKKIEAKQNFEVDLIIGSENIEKVSRRASGKDAEKLAAFARAIKEEKDQTKATLLALDNNLAALMNVHRDKSSLTTHEKELKVVVDREKVLFSAWYEMFPRSCSADPRTHGTLRDCERLLPEIARMGFDILYLPPIHPIAKTNRKGKNNSPTAGPDDPGSPWAIGSEEGGHKSIHPQLGSITDFEEFVKKATDFGIEIALDLAFHCSVNHPYVKEYPEWFLWRPDGKIQYAENPPKKYEDVVPFNFDTDRRKELWAELKSIVLFWIKKGVKIFRVDNPHTKPFEFWKWLIDGIRSDYPDVLFLSEAFTRPKVMYELAKVGFNQSYTYFTWRNTKREITEYLTELTRTDVREYFRPNFWPNTPDILTEYLQFGGSPAFKVRLVLAATLSSNYGMYGPAFELCTSEAMPGTEDYLNSEKYEIKNWERDKPGNLKDFVAKLNRIRRENEALQRTCNLEFFEVDNDSLIFYGKVNKDLSNEILIVVNLDPFHTQSGFVRVPLRELGIEEGQLYLVHDLLSGDKYIWEGEKNYVKLDPQVMPAHVFRVHKHVRHEQDFDYFM